mgnify:CR=1 FL=1
MVETSGWLLHNTTIKSVANNLEVSQTSDSYDFKTVLPKDIIHYVQYGVRSINNLEVYSPMYAVIEPGVGRSTLEVDLVAENIFEEGYIRLKLSPNNSFNSSL